jgi:hypothetical protein
MIDFIKKLFTKEETQWNEFREEKHYDLRGMPELSPTSPIKDFKLVHIYRYCPVYRKLQKRNMFSSNWIDISVYEYKNLSDEIQEFIYITDKSYQRDQKINKIIK